MRSHALTIAGCLLAILLAVPALAQSGDWQRIPPAASAGAIPTAPSGALGALGGILGSGAGNNRLGCTLVARLAEESAKARDKGVSEQSQLKTVDDPNGTLHTLAVATHLPAATTQELGATLHGEIAYVYAHREMTPAQLQAHFESECEHPSGKGE